MSERILKALMQLFAIISRVELIEDKDGLNVESTNGRKVVSAFLKTELSSVQVKVYLKMFDEYLVLHHTGTKKKDGEKKRTSVNSVKVLKICSQINTELTQRQKIIVLLRILEFIRINQDVNEQEIEFANTVSESFNVSSEDFDLLKKHIENSKTNYIESDHVLYISPLLFEVPKAHVIQHDGIDGLIRIIYIKSSNILFFKYFGKDELNMNGQIIPSDRNHILNQGSSLRTLKSKPIYYSDIISRFLNYDKSENLLFKVENVEYKFPSSKIGLHAFSFSEKSGKLVGVMGGSGSGKSTFLNVLNGNLKPSNGNIYINQYNVHKDVENLRGVIGYVSQDDILIEELSVYQNLYFNTKLCFKNLTEKQINRKVIDVLSLIGLQDVMHLKVGSPMDKTISGGQRKRLNIALELIRKPAVLFVDEPTSGLSSRDSENIMDLLKELALRGNLVFVVIHQPSSEIFKMFDRLLLLDTGGYMIFDGNPLDAVIHFKKCINHVNADEAECPNCGNVNPEQIFNIIESKVVDEYGNSTRTRKTTPEEWHQKYLQYEQKQSEENIISLPRSFSKTPGLWTQFVVFFKRDLLSKLSNRQYILLNLLEAPLLASILAFFVKFFSEKEGDNFTYSFYGNENIPQYLFISVVVSLFLGLTVTAEEIIKDKKIVKRESFLNLSRNSYLFSKIALIFILSAIQTLSFVLIGNYILEIKGMTFYYWIILFSSACSANMMGLNISAAFNSEKVIYITVPILIIPQLLFSGVIVKFDKLHPFFSKTNEVPFIGEIMISRWAYEALVVTQFKENDYQDKVYHFELEKSKSAWKRDYWLTEMTLKNETLLTKKKSKSFDNDLLVLKNEISKEESNWDNLRCKNCITELERINTRSENYELFEKINFFLDNVRKQYGSIYEANSDSLDLIAKKMGVKAFNEWKDKYENKSLTDLVLNKNELIKITEQDGQLIQKADPIYLIDKSSNLRSHFYAPEKRIGNSLISTLYFNLIVIWLFSVVLFFTLKYDLFRRILEFKIYKKH